MDYAATFLLVESLGEQVIMVSKESLKNERTKLGLQNF
jgi:hypothetical protein